MKFMNIQKLLLIIISFSIFACAVAQEDSIRAIEEITPSKIDTSHSPKIATLMSTALPGLGQIYNHSYWKVPVIYAGLYGFGYMFQQNHSGYRDFRNAYDAYLQPYADAGTTPDATETIIINGTAYSPFYAKQQRDAYRRSRDLALIGMGAWYILNIIEAYVDAHMFSFDVSDDLTLHYQPQFFIHHTSIAGLGVRLQF